MSTQSNAVSEMNVGTQSAAPVVISPFRRYYWSVRREIWENRSIYIAPAAAAAFVILGLLIGVVRGALHFSVEMSVNGMQQQPGVEAAYVATTGAIMGVALIVAAFYCMGTLHGERRDRSVLFWKSLPVSDTTTVLAKATIPFAVLPAVMMTLIVVTHTMFFLILSASLSAEGRGAAAAWPHPGLPQFWGMTLVHLVTIHVLWYAPLYCYMLMISAWAKRAPFLWAVVPPVLAGVVEKIAFNTDYVFRLLGDRLTGQSSGLVGGTGGMRIEGMDQAELMHFLGSPGLWLGLAFAALFLFVTVRLRRWQGII